MAKIPADDGGGSFGEELWGGGVAVMKEDGERRCSLIDLNFNFSASSDYTIIGTINIVSFLFDEKYLWKSNCYMA